MLTVPTLKVNPVETSITSGIPAFTSSLNVAVKLLLIDHEDFLVTFFEDSIVCGCSTEESFLKVMDLISSTVTYGISWFIVG